MTIKITIPNTSSDTLTFGSANTPTAAQIAGIDSGSSNGQLALYTTASGTSTERVRVDSSGNVGIGTNAPSQLLHLKSSNVWNKFESTYGAGFNFQIGIGADTAFRFYDVTAAAERMRIDSSGSLLVGTTTSSGLLTANQTANSAWSGYFSTTPASGVVYGIRTQFSGYTPNNTTSYFLFGGDTTGTKFAIYANGGLANFSANNVNLSDRREKTNFAPAGDYLAKICAISVQTFNYADQNLEEDGDLTLGVVAQDVQAVAPELVTETNWGTPEEPKMRLSIYQTDFQYALMKCIQEQQALITQLQADVAALKGTK